MKKIGFVAIGISLMMIPSMNAVYAKSNVKQVSKKVVVTDKDHNGIADSWQVKYHLGFGKSVASKDNDHDGLNNLTEYQLHLNPIAKSTNGKTLDGQLDSDNDGLTNNEELQLRDNPAVSDTNHNGVLDGQEDNDNDGINNEMEYQLHLNPVNADSDHDGIKDGNEKLAHGNGSIKNQIMEMEMKVVNTDGKELAVHYEWAGGKNKLEVEDQIGVGDVKTLFSQLTLTSDMSNDQMVAQVEQIFALQNVSTISVQVEFGSGKKKDANEKHSKHSGTNLDDQHQNNQGDQNQNNQDDQNEDSQSEN